MARTFNGTSDNIQFADDSAYNTLTTFSAFVLVRPTSTISSERVIINKVNPSYLGQYFISATTTNQVFSYLTREGGNDCYAFSPNNTLVVNSWNAVIVTWAGDGNTPVLYSCVIGGTATDVTAATQVGSGVLHSGTNLPFQVGGREPADAVYWAGGIADFGLWNRVLNSTEINMLGKGYSPSVWITSGLVLASKINGIDSPEINTQGGPNGTVTGTTLLTHPPTVYTMYEEECEYPVTIYA